ncbi:4-alpha-glucanotransferase [Aggregatibacter actinomycetemcomitans]|uniref:4-alpha-glucanotransferase n=1 Tax=Aggregatibacter actinomycetemcomitans TaxID=714 RepID=UPI0011D89ADA|nr:4-alpha-glucanotransferase [Aggregatibacter actinomycetemcomitans]QEH47578.1 4-alpha-glucanotransferase [Aggregatibacter actinomycetemcomitans]TYA48355.1 4-alpha-glucanotransferase [Aggregatibacter actinomycetemcomitans]
MQIPDSIKQSTEKLELALANYDSGRHLIYASTQTLSYFIKLPQPPNKSECSKGEFDDVITMFNNDMIYYDLTRLSLPSCSLHYQLFDEQGNKCAEHSLFDFPSIQLSQQPFRYYQLRHLMHLKKHRAGRCCINVLDIFEYQDQQAEENTVGWRKKLSKSFDLIFNDEYIASFFCLIKHATLSEDSLWLN